jgi:hypothetical protein
LSDKKSPVLHLRAKKRAQDLSASFHQDLIRVLDSPEPRRDRLYSFSAPILSKLLSTRNFSEIRPENLWRDATRIPRFNRDFFDLLELGLGVTLSSLWREALSTVFLPRVPERLSLYQPSTRERVTTSFESGVVTEVDRYAAAWMVLHDAWLYLMRGYHHIDNSPIVQLSCLTREVDHPALRISHCLRDLAHGQAGRAEDLLAMVKTYDPAYRELFREAMWID